jgi:hypothetical protein
VEPTNNKKNQTPIKKSQPTTKEELTNSKRGIEQ